MKGAKVRYAGLLLGIGLGGFFDGIVFHQIAQWHSMLSAVLPPHDMQAMRTSMAADGWFHAVTWLATLAGVLTLWTALRGPGPVPPARALPAWMLIGWGAFNLVEGVVDHHLLQLHHVRDLPQHVPAYDWLFLLIGGIGLLVLGVLLKRASSAASAPL